MTSQPSVSAPIWSTVCQVALQLLGLAFTAMMLSQVVDIELSVDHLRTGIHLKGNALLQWKKEPEHSANE